MGKLLFLVLFSSLALLHAQSSSRCYSIEGQQGLWFEYNGKVYPCASTTRYYNGDMGSCGCGSGSGSGTCFPWQYQTWTGSGNPPIFDDDEATWCGTGCGVCFQLTPTGYSANGSPPPSLESHVIMLTDLCESDNNCPADGPNQFGYLYNFDLMDYNANGGPGLITEAGWINPEVWFMEVPCSEQQTQNWDECQCADEDHPSEYEGPGNMNNSNPSNYSRCYSIPGHQGLWFESGGVTYPCASTTRYYDGNMGSCGCGTGSGNGNCFPWQYETWTGAANQPIFGPNGADWCGSGCGVCFQITPTGYSADGSPPPNLEPHVIMITDLCPPDAFNVFHCPASGPNGFGYLYHFDLMDHASDGGPGLVTAAGWIDPEVYFVEVPCDQQYVTNWKTCECASEDHPSQYDGPGDMNVTATQVQV